MHKTLIYITTSIPMTARDRAQIEDKIHETIDHRIPTVSVQMFEEVIVS